jgi:hypothetical protein
MAGAEQLLCSDSGLKPARVCEAVGCHDTVQFIRDFKAQYGIPQQNANGKKHKKKTAGTLPTDEASRCFFHIMIRMFCWIQTALICQKPVLVTGGKSK